MLNEEYQTLSAYRVRLQRTRDKMKMSEAELKKKIEEPKSYYTSLKTRQSFWKTHELAGF